MPPHCQITLHFLKTNLLALTDTERTSDSSFSDNSAGKYSQTGTWAVFIS